MIPRLPKLPKLPKQIEQAPTDVPLWARQELEERITAGTGGPFGVLWACDRLRDIYGSRRVPDPLRRWLDESRSPVLLQALLERLKQMERDPSIAAAVARRIDDHEGFGLEVLYEALAVLAAHAAAEHLEVFRRYLAHAEDALRTVAVEAVVASGRPEGSDAILRAFAELTEPVAAFFLLQGLFALGDAGAAERAGRLVVERLAGGSLESAYCLGVSLDPLDFGFHLHDRATRALYPQLAEPDRRSDEDMEDLLVVGSNPAGRRLAEAVAPAGVRKRLESLARAEEHLHLVEALLGLLRRAVALVEEEAPPFAGRARMFLGFLDAAVAAPRFVKLSPDVHQQFAIWAAGALAHVLRGRDPVRDAEAAREDISAALDLLATDVSLPPRVTVDIVRRAPIEMIEELDSELDFTPEGPSACQQLLLGARLPEKCLLDLIEYHPRNEDFRRDLAAVAAQVAGDTVLAICARGLVKGLVELEDFLEAIRNLGTRRSREYLEWCWSAVEEQGSDAALVLDLALACGGAELWRRALESFRRGRLQPDVESGRGDLLVRAAMLLGLLGIEDDPGAVVESAVEAYRKRRADQPAAETTSAGGEESEEPARPGKGEQLEPSGKPAAETSRGLSGGSRGKLRSGGGPPSIETIRREAEKVGRNDPCPCGSGKKYKKCCGAQG